jgi:hypothetical protein
MSKFRGVQNSTPKLIRINPSLVQHLHLVNMPRKASQPKTQTKPLDTPQKNRILGAKDFADAQGVPATQKDLAECFGVTVHQVQHAIEYRHNPRTGQSSRKRPIEEMDANAQPQRIAKQQKAARQADVENQAEVVEESNGDEVGLGHSGENVS